MLRICNALLTARGGLSLSEALNIYHTRFQDEWPAASLDNLLFLLVKKVATNRYKPPPQPAPDSL